MHLVEILRNIRDLHLYSAEDWEEYLSSFEGAEALRAHLAQLPPSDGGELAQRIRSGQGARPAEPHYASSPKLVSLDALAECKTHEEFTLGIVSGAFDLLHLGHVRSMRYAKEYLASQPNARLCALTLRDDHIAAKKGPTRPVLNAQERLEIIAAVRFVDYAVLLCEPNCLNALECLRPEIFFKSEGDMAQAVVREETDRSQSLGGKVEFVPSDETRILSTTRMVGTVRQGGLAGCVVAPPGSSHLRQSRPDTARS